MNVSSVTGLGGSPKPSEETLPLLLESTFWTFTIGIYQLLGKGQHMRMHI